MDGQYKREDIFRFHEDIFMIRFSINKVLHFGFTFKTNLRYNMYKLKFGVEREPKEDLDVLSDGVCPLPFALPIPQMQSRAVALRRVNNAE